MEEVVINFKDFMALVDLERDLIPSNNLIVSLKILEWMMMMILGFSLEEMEAKKIVTTHKKMLLDLEGLEVLEDLEDLVMMTSWVWEVVNSNHFNLQILEVDLEDQHQYLPQQQYSMIIN